MTTRALYEIYLAHPLICTDSRNLLPNSIFFALKGDNFDGNLFVSQALKQTCAYAISDCPANASIPNCIIVPDVLLCLQQLAHYHRKQLNIPILAITGTNGKTTTKELTAAVLRSKYRTLATQGNLNNHIGVPLTLLRITPETQVAIIEMGANHIGEIAFLCKIAEPTMGLICNVGKAHLEGFGSFEGVKQAKGELYTYLAHHQGIIFVNKDNKLLMQMFEFYVEAKHAPELLHTYSADTLEAKLDSNALNLQFTINPKDGLTPMQSVCTHLVGTYNFDNILAALAIGEHLQVCSQAALTALEQYQPTNNRSQCVQMQSNTLILDAYNANPSSMSAALANFAELKQSNKIVILGDMFELGSSSLMEHQNIVKLVNEIGCSQAYFIGSQFALAIASQANPAHFYSFVTKTDFISYLQANPIKHAFILLKGSRGMGLEEIAAQFKNIH